MSLSINCILGEDVDMFWNGNPLIWLYDGVEYSSYWKLEKYFKNWPSEMIGQFPMKGTSHLYLDSSSIGELNLLRTALVYMVPLRDSLDTTEWRYTEHKDNFIGGISESQMLYDRIMLPGTYKMNEQAIYLFADSGDI